MEIRDKVTLAGVWHDVGKIVRRSGVSGEHSHVGAEFLKEQKVGSEIVTACRYHHGKFLQNAKLNIDNIAYIVYVADNISSSADRRIVEGDDSSAYGFDEHICLKSVFNILNNNNQKLGYSDANIKNLDELNFPTEICSLSAGKYSKILNKIKEILKCEKYSINSILELIEAIMSDIPSCTARNDLNDISLYDHSKLTGGLSICIYDYLCSQGINDFKSELFKNEKSFMNKKAFILASFDISGIQKFIYSIPSQDALKQLRARSAYLDIISENLVDDILEELNLSRANLLYLGGGHCYMILPNTEVVKDKFYEIIKKQNKWLMGKFRETLFISNAIVECTANELSNKDENGFITGSNYFGNLFNKLQYELSKSKMQRYTLEDIKSLNSMESNGERECSVCGNSSVDINKSGKCEMCEAFTTFGKSIINPNTFFALTKKKIQGYTNLPMSSFKFDESYMQIIEIDKSGDFYSVVGDDNILRVYGKNSFNVGEKYCSKIFMGDYCAMRNGVPMSFDDFENQSEGIKKLAVFRADVDNLGLTFKNGFKRDGDFKYETLSRFATLSRSMSRFFKLYINQIFNDKYAKYSKINLFNTPNGQRNISIIYSGGDDLCLVGSYNDVIRSAIDLIDCFNKYCAGTMTMSGGIGLYSSGYPISRMAFEVGGLEDVSKACQGKDSITLFDDSGNYTFKWQELYDEVLCQKFKFIQNYFDKKDYSNDINSSSFIHNLIELLRLNKRYQIAYMLARLLDGKNTYHNQFINQIYEWSRGDKDRKQLITALMLYLYSVREDKNV